MKTKQECIKAILKYGKQSKNVKKIYEEQNDPYERWNNSIVIETIKQEEISILFLKNKTISVISFNSDRIVDFVITIDNHLPTFKYALNLIKRLC